MTGLATEPHTRVRLAYRAMAALAIAFLAVACGEPVAAPEPVFIQAAGSTTMGPLVRELTTAFSQKNPDITVEVASQGTKFGVEALRLGKADVAMASWLPSVPADAGAGGTREAEPGPGAEGTDFWEQDLGSGFKVTAIAQDGIAVIVHPSNPVDGLGLLQLQELFSGRAYEWRAVGGRGDQGVVEVVSREDGSGTRQAFEMLVMEGLEVTPRAVVAPSTEAVVEYVSGHRAAIGYVSMAFQTPGIKALSIEGVLPTPQSAGQGSYVLTRELWLLTVDPPPRAVADLVRFALSPVGQQIVGEQYGRIR